jgi:hypothetical protein
MPISQGLKAIGIKKRGYLALELILRNFQGSVLHSSETDAVQLYCSPLLGSLAVVVSLVGLLVSSLCTNWMSFLAMPDSCIVTDNSCSHRSCGPSAMSLGSLSCSDFRSLKYFWNKRIRNHFSGTEMTLIVCPPFPVFCDDCDDDDVIIKSPSRGK